MDNKSWIEEFEERFNVFKYEEGEEDFRGFFTPLDFKSFISSQIEKAYNQGKQDGIKSIGLERKPDLNLEPGFNITAEYRLGEIRGFNEYHDALEQQKQLKLKE